MMIIFQEYRSGFKFLASSCVGALWTLCYGPDYDIGKKNHRKNIDETLDYVDELMKDLFTKKIPNMWLQLQAFKTMIYSCKI